MKATLHVCVLMLVVSNTLFCQELAQAPIRVVGMQYPPLAVVTGVKGTIKAKCTVSAEGKVLAVEIVEVSSILVRNLIGKDVEENLSQWLFVPSTERSIVISYSFDLVVRSDPSKVSKFVFDSPGSVHVGAEISDLIVP